MYTLEITLSPAILITIRCIFLYYHSPNIKTAVCLFCSWRDLVLQNLFFPTWKPVRLEGLWFGLVDFTLTYPCCLSVIPALGILECGRRGVYFQEVWQ